MKPSELTVTDLFCGAGGSSQGAAAAGIVPRLALNHWERAIETHNTNFPEADHICADVMDMPTLRVRRLDSTHVLIASPECTNHSQAKSRRAQATLFDPHGADEAERSRATMMDVPRFAEAHRYEIVVVENVLEVTRWPGFAPWLSYMHNLGYAHRSCSINSLIAHPTPQSRDRMYWVFWRQGNPAPNLRFEPRSWCPTCERAVAGQQSWRRPGTRWGKYRQQYDYRCPECRAVVYPFAFGAVAAIDWALPIQRIADRARPLAPATRRRIQLGLDRFGHLGDLPAWLLPVARSQDERLRPRSVTEPMPTQTTQQEWAVASAACIAKLRRSGRLTPAFYVKNYGTAEKAGPMAHHVSEPLGTVTATDHHSLVTMPFLTGYHGRGVGAHPVIEPSPTVDTRDRYGLVAPASQVEDCGFRMLEPHEIQAAMAFTADYQVLGSKRERVRQLGNAVTPPVMQMLLERCVETLA